MTLRDKMDSFLWQDKQHILIKDFVDWCQKYLYLPRTSSFEVILKALQSATAALTGEKTFYLADNYDEISKKYEGLRPQFKSTSNLNLDNYIVKTEIAEIQQNEVSDPTKPSGENSGEKPPGIIIDPIKDPDIPPIDAPLSPKNFRGTLKLDPTNASLKTSQFMSEVMSHLQALPGSEIDITLEVNVKNKNGIDKQTARIILENSITLKIDNPEIF